MTYQVTVVDLIFPECGEITLTYTTTPIQTPSILNDVSLTIFPNPVIRDDASIIIETGEILKDASVSVYNIEGKLISILADNTDILINKELNFDTNVISSGVYFVHLATSKGILTQKFVKL